MKAPAPDGHDRVGAFALYPLRLGLAAVFLFTGTEKLLDVEANAALVALTGVPWPEFVAVAVGSAEVLGALALLLGVLTRTAAAGLSLLMLSILLTLKVPGPFWGDGWGIDVAVLAGTITLALNGPGRPTLLSALGWDPAAARARLRSRVLGAREAEDAAPRSSPTGPVAPTDGRPGRQR